MIKGLDAFTRQLAEAGKAAAVLDGNIVSLNFDPADARSIQKAIHHMERAVDAKVGRYRNNPLVADMVKQAKAQFREAIRRKAREANVRAS
ncbi:hypothetical protein [Sandaracinobacteroides hominis]|uniref:hypothetical protein n=1 Tax=Sandaracinobacteroides hominis TaxID=2780086 RepID=UPI0018F313EB|nr:hypothetical protein [Sandaracinobacteroides hominis]